jgi:hypothetical protein
MDTGEPSAMEANTSRAPRPNNATLWSSRYATPDCTKNRNAFGEKKPGDGGVFVKR